MLIDNIRLNIKLINSHTKEVSKQYLRKYDFSIARAVAPMYKLCKFCIPFVKPGGYFIAMKGPSYINEINDPRFRCSNDFEVYRFSYGDEFGERIILKIKNPPPQTWK